MPWAPSRHAGLHKHGQTLGPVTLSFVESSRLSSFGGYFVQRVCTCRGCPL